MSQAQPRDADFFQSRLEQLQGEKFQTWQIERLEAAVDEASRRLQSAQPVDAPAGKPPPLGPDWDFMVCVGMKAALIKTVQGAACVDWDNSTYLVYGDGIGGSVGVKGDIGLLAAYVQDGDVTGEYKGEQGGLSFFHLGADAGYFSKIKGNANDEHNFLVRLRYTPGLGLDFSENSLTVRHFNEL